MGGYRLIASMSCQGAACPRVPEIHATIVGIVGALALLANVLTVFTERDNNKLASELGFCIGFCIVMFVLLCRFMGSLALAVAVAALAINLVAIAVSLRLRYRKPVYG